MYYASASIIVSKSHVLNEREILHTPQRPMAPPAGRDVGGPHPWGVVVSRRSRNSSLAGVAPVATEELRRRVAGERERGVAGEQQPEAAVGRGEHEHQVELGGGGRGVVWSAQPGGKEGAAGRHELPDLDERARE
jgi:hypothetical protein